MNVKKKNTFHKMCADPNGEKHKDTLPELVVILEERLG